MWGRRSGGALSGAASSPATAAWWSARKTGRPRRGGRSSSRSGKTAPQSSSLRHRLRPDAPRPGTGARPMPTRRTVLLIAASTLGMPYVVGVTPAVAAEASATAFVTKIYDAYKGENSKGILIDTRAAIRRYFEPSLAALISKDQKDAARRHDVPTLDGDPFIYAQDWTISAVAIAVRDP